MVLNCPYCGIGKLEVEDSADFVKRTRGMEPCDNCGKVCRVDFYYDEDYGPMYVPMRKE